MSPGPIFDRVYAALKAQLLGGRWAPGTHLEPASLGEDLNASVTPVRDALHRLIGERLIETPRHDGFWVPLVSEAELRELYGWNGELLALAVRRRKIAFPDRGAQQDTAVDAASLFRTIARAAQSNALEQAIASSNDRLAALRLAECWVFDNLSDELESLARRVREDDLRGLRREMAAYHRRRQRAASPILAALRRESDRAE